MTAHPHVYRPRANSVNLSGLYSKTPVKLHEDDGWWDRNGNFDAPAKDGPYSEVNGAVRGFASSDKREVEIWTDGVLAAMSGVKRWAE